VRFDFALLADYAQTIHGKLFVQGGGLTRVTVGGLPWLQSIAVCMRLEFDEDDDSGRPYHFQIQVVDPEGDAIFDHGAPIAWQAPPTEVLEGEDRGAFIAVTLNGVPFQRTGPHRVTLAVDGARAELSFAVAMADVVGEPLG
jgi:hypothetical protein